MNKNSPLHSLLVIVGCKKMYFFGISFFRGSYRWTGCVAPQGATCTSGNYFKTLTRCAAVCSSSQSLTRQHNLNPPHMTTVTHRGRALTSQLILCVVFFLHKDKHFLCSICDAEYISKATVCRAIRDMSITLQINQHHPQKSSKDKSFTFYLVSRRQICGHTPSANLGFRILVCLPGFFCLFFFFFRQGDKKVDIKSHSSNWSLQNYPLALDSFKVWFIKVHIFYCQLLLNVSTAEPKREESLDSVSFKLF